MWTVLRDEMVSGSGEFPELMNMSFAGSLSGLGQGYPRARPAINRILRTLA
jgi:hypothetical protein